MIRQNWQDELFDSKSFWSLYRDSKKYVSSKFNLILSIVVGCALLALFFVTYQIEGDRSTYKAVVGATRTVLSLSVAYSSSILGFLVSGFALFFAITKSEILVLLAKIDHTDSSISRLRFVLMSFMFVFAHYIAFLLTTLIFSVLVAPNGVLPALLHGSVTARPDIWAFAGAAAVSVLAAWLTYLVMLLKSFVWNLYQTVLIAITVGDDLKSGRLEALVRATNGDEARLQSAAINTGAVAPTSENQA